MYPLEHSTRKMYPNDIGLFGRCVCRSEDPCDVSARTRLGSASGRMQYHISGAFAQFQREQIIENVELGMTQAVREGRWVNRAKTGYAMVDRRLVPNGDAPIVRRIFRLRAEGLSCREIESETGIKYSTVLGILGSRIYLGEVLFRGAWSPGIHEPLITRAEFEAAQFGRLGKRRQSRDVLSGFVRCGTCGRSASAHYNPDGKLFYRCKHRGQGCHQPARRALGLQRAALLGLDLIARDDRLQEAIRRKIRATGVDTGKSGARRHAKAVAELTEKRRKLLELHYQGKISADFFAEEEPRLTAALAAVRAEVAEEKAREDASAALGANFEAVVEVLRNFDLAEAWEEASDAEKRVLLGESLEAVYVFSDHLEVAVKGAPRINVLLAEVGLKDRMSIGGVGGAWRLRA